jgi:phenylalanyl-tRNA synthetase beta chain
MLYMENIPRDRPVRGYVPLPRFPGTRRDIAVVVDEHVIAGELMRAVRDVHAPAFEDVAAFDEYVGPQVESGKKSVALALMFRLNDGTITDAQADASMNAIVGSLKEKFGAVLRGPAPA